MIFAAILAGGAGNRMGEVDKPKQFLKLGDKPIIIQTVEKFSLNNQIDQIIVLCHKYWINHTKDLVNQYFPNSTNIVVIEGGELRNDTIMNAIYYIEDNFEIDENDIILTHDSVRPFLTHRIIMENIEKTIERHYIKGELTEAQEVELLQLAADNADDNLREGLHQCFNDNRQSVNQRIEQLH